MSAQLFTDSCHPWPKDFVGKTKLQNLRSGPSPTSLQIDGNNVESIGCLQNSKVNSLSDMKRRISLAASIVSSLSRIWRDKIFQLSTKIRLYQALVMSVLLYAAETWTLLLCDKKTLEAFHMKCQRQILHIHWSQACHKCKNICSHRLTTCYGPHQKTSFVSIRPHSSAHSEDSSTERHTLPSWPSIRSFTW